MRRILVMTFTALLFGLTPFASFAASISARPTATNNPSIVLVDGWWEQEHREQPARDGYFRLPPQRMSEYNRLQAEINQLQRQRTEIDLRLSRALRAQHEMLGMGDRDRR